MAEMFPKVLRLYALAATQDNAMDRQVSSAEVDDYLSDLSQAHVDRFPATGKGEHLIVSGQAQQGMGLMVAERLCHLYTSPFGWVRS